MSDSARAGPGLVPIEDRSEPPAARRSLEDEVAVVEVVMAEHRALAAIEVIGLAVEQMLEQASSAFIFDAELGSVPQRTEKIPRRGSEAPGFTQSVEFSEEPKRTDCIASTAEAICRWARTRFAVIELST